MKPIYFGFTGKYIKKTYLAIIKWLSMLSCLDEVLFGLLTTPDLIQIYFYRAKNLFVHTGEHARMENVFCLKFCYTVRPVN
jgi:hypothetical protein